MKILRLLALLPLLAGCYSESMCDAGTPMEFKPSILRDSAGKAYYVEHYNGCTFSVREVRE